MPGMKPVLELLERNPERVDMVYVRRGRAGADSARLLDLCREYGVRFSLVGDDALARMAAHAGHQGVIARLRETAFMPWETFLAQAADAPLPLMVALDQVQDPGNVGTLARTLFAMGGAGLILPRHNSAFLGPGARRSAAGALERLPITQVVNLSRAVKEARDAGFTTCAAQKVDDSVNPLTENCLCPRCSCSATRTKACAPACSNTASAACASPSAAISTPSTWRRQEPFSFPALPALWSCRTAKRHTVRKAGTPFDICARRPFPPRPDAPPCRRNPTACAGLSVPQSPPVPSVRKGPERMAFRAFYFPYSAQAEAFLLSGIPTASAPSQVSDRKCPCLRG